MSKIFGGSKSKSQQSSQQTSSNESGNLAHPAVNTEYMPEAANSFQSGARALQAGLTGGYDAYKANTNFDFWEKMGLKKTAGGYAGRGLFNTGATMKALANYEQDIGSASYGDYLTQQGNLAGLGIQGGNLVSGAGQYSKGESQGTSQGTSVSKQYDGMGKFIGQIIGAAAASDERLKMDITKIGEHAGLGIYNYTYISGQGPYVGVMAQEVADQYPEAMGPEVGGYLTVDYNKLQELTGEIKYG